MCVPVLAVLPGLGVCVCQSWLFFQDWVCVCASPGCSSRTGCVCQSWLFFQDWVCVPVLAVKFSLQGSVACMFLVFVFLDVFHSPSSDSHELFSFLSNDLCEARC